MKKILLLIILVSQTLMASADIVEIDGICYKLDTNEKTAEVVSSSTKYTGAISIPETVTHESVIYCVIGIGANAFNGCSGLNSISIGNNVIEIGAYAFWGCYNLTSITIPENVITIGSYSFYGCSSLTSVTIGNNVTNIGECAFYNCSNVTSMTIGNSVKRIGEKVFYNCSGLTSITIPGSVVSIGGSAFENCTGLKKVIVPDIAAWCNISFRSNPLSYAHHIFSDEETEIIHLIIPEGVTTISTVAFASCSSLTSVKIPSSVTNIGANAFKNCSGLTKVIVPDIAAWCGVSFGRLSGDRSNSNPVSFVHHIYSDEETEIDNLIIPEGVTDIASDVFSGCSSLTSVTIPEGVVSIGSSAFADCSSLTSVTIPESVESIGSSAFSGCNGITSVTLNSNPVVSASRNNETSMQSIFGKQVKEYTIGNAVTSIGSYAFAGCSSLTSVIIPESIKSISNDAFRGCSGLTSVKIPIGTNDIGSGAFYGCTGLTSITIPESVNYIREHSFWGCDNLITVTLESNTPVSKPFSYYSSLKDYFGAQVKEYILGDNVSNIGDYAFCNCDNLYSVVIGSGVTSIGEHAFYCCDNLSSIVIGSAVTSIGDYAFYYCGNLSSVVIGSGVTSIGDYAFYGCHMLTSVTLDSNSIVSASRTSSSSLSSIFGNQVNTYILGDAVTSIGNNAFQYCSNMLSIKIPPSLKRVMAGAFKGCTSLTKVVISDIASWCGIIYDGNNDCDYPLYYAKHLYSDDNTEIKEIVIPEGVTRIEAMAFRDADHITSISIPNSVTSIGDYAFYSCDNLSSIVIGSGVESIESSAFNNCDSLISVTLDSNPIVSASRTSSTSLSSIFGDQVRCYVIGNAVNSIGQNAFCNCTNLFKIIVGNSVTSIENDAFSGCDDVKIFVNHVSDGLLALWDYGTDPYEIGTSRILLRPSISVLSTTQTAIMYSVNNMYPELEYQIEDEYIGEKKYLIKGLRPNYTQTIPLTVQSANNSYKTSTNATTLPISPILMNNNVTASSMSVQGSYTEGDAKVISRKLVIDGNEMDWEEGTLHGLQPNTSYSCSYIVVVEYGEANTWAYEYSTNIRTASLTFIAQQPKVISAGNVVVAAETNIDDAETKIGFEWRRTDWTDDFASNSGTAYLYDGKIEGYIRNLNTEKLWKYRPYYESNSCNRFYGDWVGIDPTNTSYFEPNVYTYPTYSVSGNKVEVKGYVMRGSDNISKQGFMYWKKESNVMSVPANAVMLEAKGNVMVATLENLDYDTEYCYVAFVTTSENETFYGEEQTFKTDEPSQDVIDGIILNEELRVKNEEFAAAMYDLNGRKLSAPRRGLNIIRMSDGSARKIMIK